MCQCVSTPYLFYEICLGIMSLLITCRLFRQIVVTNLFCNTCQQVLVNFSFFELQVPCVISFTNSSQIFEFIFGILSFRFKVPCIFLFDYTRHLYGIWYVVRTPCIHIYELISTCFLFKYIPLFQGRTKNFFLSLFGLMSFMG